MVNSRDDFSTRRMASIRSIQLIRDQFCPNVWKEHFGKQAEAKLVSREPFTSIQPEWQDVQIRISTAMYSELGRVNMEPQLTKQKTPLLVIVGRRDAVVPPSGIRSGYDMYAGRKKWVELSGSHHLPFVDEPDTFAKTIASFVR